VATTGSKHLKNNGIAYIDVKLHLCLLDFGEFIGSGREVTFGYIAQ